MWAERNRVRPRRDEEPKPSRWWRSRWNVALPARKARNRFLGLRLWRSSPTRRPAACTDFSKPKSSPARQSGNQRWLARVPGAGAARLSAYRHALARRSGGRSSTLSLVHITLSNLKRFLLGTHHKVESQHLQRYVAEFNYRLNRCTMETNLFQRLVRACLTTNTVIYKELIAVPDQA